MPYLGLRPGYWFHTGNAVLCSPPAYMQQVAIPLRRDPLYRSIPIGRLPAAPRDDRLVTPASEAGEWRLYGLASSDPLTAGDPAAAYAVQRHAKRMLESLCSVVEAVGTRERQSVGWIEREYPLQVPVIDSPLGLHCLRVAHAPTVQEAARRFVSEFGPLVADFSGWCCTTDIASSLFATKLHGLKRFDSLLLISLGLERSMWPRKWRLWARGIRTAFESLFPVQPWVPLPVAFYVWAGYMFILLTEKPDGGPSRLFLANRLASLRLAIDPAASPPPVAALRARRASGLLDASALPTAPDQGEAPAPYRTPSPFLFGDLLDYLALSVIYGPKLRAVLESGAPVICANCDRPFATFDGRRRYCDSCQQLGLSDAVRAKRYRDRQREGPSPA